MKHTTRSLWSVVALILASQTALAWADGEGRAGKHFDFQGYKAFYVEAGQGPPMIFVHNGGTSHRIWEHQLSHFAKKYHVYAMDNLGFGDSDKPDIDYPLDLHIAQLAAFVDHIGAKKVTLVGHCMGGSMSLNFTARHPDKVEKLVLCNVYTEQTLLSGILAETYRTYAADPSALDRAIARIKSAPPTSDRYSDDPRAQLTLQRVIARADTYGISDRLKLPAGMPPMLLIWGEQNPVLTLEAGKKLCENLQAQRFSPLAGCHHMAMMEDPAAFNCAMGSFLAE